MQSVVNLAGITSAVAGSFAVSMLLGWLSLRGILLLMPARNARAVIAQRTNGGKADWAAASQAQADRQRAA